MVFRYFTVLCAVSVRVPGPQIIQITQMILDLKQVAWSANYLFSFTPLYIFFINNDFSMKNGVVWFFHALVVFVSLTRCFRDQKT